MGLRVPPVFLPILFLIGIVLAGAFEQTADHGARVAHGTVNGSSGEPSNHSGPTAHGASNVSSSQHGGGSQPHLAAPAIFYVMLTLVIGAVAQLLIHHVHHYVTIPYPVFLLVLGFMYGVVTQAGYGLSQFTSIASVHGEIILLIFLPVLIFEAAVTMQTHLFQKLLPHMLIIGTIGMALCFVSTAYFSVMLFNYKPNPDVNGSNQTGAAPHMWDEPVDGKIGTGNHGTEEHINEPIIQGPMHDGGQENIAHDISTNRRNLRPMRGYDTTNGTNGILARGDEHGVGFVELRKNSAVDDEYHYQSEDDARASSVENGDQGEAADSEVHVQTMHNQWTIQVGLLFAAVVSVTDPVAGVDLLKHYGSAKSLMTVLEGTSLISEATGIILFNIFAKTLDSDSTLLFGGEAAYVARIIIGGPVWGLFMGFVVTQLLFRMSNIWEAEAILIISAPYVTFWCADAVFHISGALATVVLGLYLSSHRACMNVDVEEFMHKLWEILALIANTLIFSLFGMLIAQVAMKGVPADDWWKLLIINLFIITVRGASCFLLMPLLCRIGLGQRTFTWRHTSVLVWTGFRGAVTLALASVAAETYFHHYPDLAEKMVFHSAGIVAFTLLVNATTLRMLLRMLGMLEMPVSKLIGINMAFQHLLHVRQTEMDTMSMDRYMTDADWTLVDKYTRLNNHEFGTERSHQKLVWTAQYFNHDQQVGRGCHDCPQSEREEPSKHELAEMDNIARLRVVKAKKTSYWKQYAEGTLSQKGVEHLDDITDIVLHSDVGVISADDIQHYLINEKWSGFKRRFSTFQRWVDNKGSPFLDLPVQSWRTPFLRLALSKEFEIFIYIIILGNFAETVTDWLLTSSDTGTPDGDLKIVFAYTSLTFLIIYTAEALIKIFGMTWTAYWGSTWRTWNRFDLLILLVTYLDIIFAFLAIYGGSHQEGVDAKLPLSVVRGLRFFRLVRFGRVIRLLKPAIPYILGFLDNRVNGHLFFGYDIARAYVVGQEETGALMTHIIGYRPMVVHFKTELENDCKTIAKEIGLLNETRPDIAAAVKTRQAARCILNHMTKHYLEMRRKGLLEEDDVEHLMMNVDEQVKTLRSFPYSLSVKGDRERLWNVPWINGSREVLEIMKSLFVEKSFEKNDVFLPLGGSAEFVYFVTSGVVSLEYTKVYEDAPAMGEIYNSDNLEATPEEEFVERTTRVDYVLAGTMLNVQSVLLGFPRRSRAKCETGVSVLCLDRGTLFKALGAVPALEDRLWRRVSTCVALNIIAKQTGAMDNWTMDDVRGRLARGAIRIVRPGVKLRGLDKFSEVYLIAGLVTIPGSRRRTNQLAGRQSAGNMLAPGGQNVPPSSLVKVDQSEDKFPVYFNSGMETATAATNREIITAPRKIHASISEIEVQKGRDAINDESGWMIYPEYAVILLIPPGEHDLSSINIHDSQLYVASTEEETSPVTNIDNDTYQSNQTMIHPQRQSDVGQIVNIVKEEERRRSRLSFNAFMQHRRYSSAAP